MGPQLEVTADTVIAVTGADMPASVNGEAVESWTLARREGRATSSRSSYLRGGARAYLGLAGGIDVPAIFGSRATYTLVRDGRLRGPRPGRGRRASRSCPTATARPAARSPRTCARSTARRPSCGVVVGLSTYRLQPEQPRGVPRDEWTVTPDANRIGYRYRGGELRFVDREPPHGAGSDPSNVDRHRLPHRLDPGAGRRRADRAARRRRHRRRLRHDRDDHQRRPRPRRAEQDERARRASSRWTSTRRCAAAARPRERLERVA